MNNLYLENGEIYLVDAPEKPTYNKWVEQQGQINGAKNYGDMIAAYPKRVEQALLNKIPVAVESRELAIELISEYNVTKNHNSALEEKTLYPIDNLEVEIKHKCKEDGHNEVFKRTGSKCTCGKQVAILKTKP
jgi:hypothetical protein